MITFSTKHFNHTSEIIFYVLRCFMCSYEFILLMLSFILFFTIHTKTEYFGSVFWCFDKHNKMRKRHSTFKHQKHIKFPHCFYEYLFEIKTIINTKSIRYRKLSYQYSAFKGFIYIWNGDYTIGYIRSNGYYDVI